VKKVLFLYKSLNTWRDHNKCGEDVWKRQATPLMMSHLCESEIWEEVASLVFGENSKIFNKIQDSEDVSEDVISSLGEGTPQFSHFPVWWS